MSDTEQTDEWNEPFDLERESLDQPPGFEQDWGGDGSNLNRPVRAHILAALRPNAVPYTPPVDALLQLGDPRDEKTSQRRNSLGLAQKDLPELLRMMRDRELYTSTSEGDEGWGPLQAFFALEDLDISGVVPEIIPLLDLEADWYGNHLPKLFAQAGEPAIEPLQTYLNDPTRWHYGRSTAADALGEIAEAHPQQRDRVISILSDILRDAERHDEVVDTGAMSALVELRAVETLPLIRHAFEIGKIDEMMRGPWGEVLKELGIEPDKDDPLVEASARRHQELREELFPEHKRKELLESIDRFTAQQRAKRAAEQARAAVQKAAQERSRKQKSKRKAASAARKANKRKRK